MIVPDANLLLYAHDSSSIFHERARHWWEACLSGNEPIGLTHAVVFAYLRISTSIRVYENPLSLAEAHGHIHGWLERSVARVLLPDGDHVERTLALLEAAGSAGGNFVSDAQIAALAMAHRAEVHTADRDFLRFPGLECRFPLTD